MAQSNSCSTTLRYNLDATGVEHCRLYRLGASETAPCYSCKHSRPELCVLETKTEVFLSCIPFLIAVQGLSTKSVTIFSSALFFCTGLPMMIWKEEKKQKNRQEIRVKRKSSFTWLFYVEQGNFLLGLQQIFFHYLPYVQNTFFGYKM